MKTPEIPKENVIYKRVDKRSESIKGLCLKSIPPQQFFVLKSSNYTQ